MFIEKEKQSTFRNSILSAVKPNQEILNLNQEDVQLKTKSQLKKKIIIYIDNYDYYIEHSTAYALKLISTRAIMSDKPKLIKLNNDLLNKLKNNVSIEIEYVKIEKIEKKEKLIVYVSNNQYYIDYSAAYALGLIKVEELYNSENQYFYINETLLKELNAKYDIKMHALSLSENSKKK